MAALGGLAGYTGFDPQLMNLQNAMYAANGGAPASESNRIGKQLSPFGGAGGAASSATMAAMDVVGSRMGGAGAGGYASMDGSGLGTGIATGEATRDWTAWGQAFGGHANQSQRDQVDGYSATYDGILLGIDKDLHNRWRAGGAFSYSNTYVSNSGDTSGNSAHINGYGLIGYARYQGDPWYVNLSATAANQQYSTSRAITSIPGFSGTAQGKFSGMQYATRAEAGYPIPLKNDWILTPLGSLTYSYQNQSAYTETGGNGAGLSVDATHANSIKSGLGARLEKSYSTSYGQVVPFIQAQWIHEYNTSPQATSAGFSIDPSSTAFTTYGASPIANMADVALGVTLIKANNLSVSARYEVQAARGFFAQTGFVKLQMKF
jgi:outer membrane autotransporter protein